MQFNLSTLAVLTVAMVAVNTSPLPAQSRSVQKRAEGFPTWGSERIEPRQGREDDRDARGPTGFRNNQDEQEGEERLSQTEGEDERPSRSERLTKAGGEDERLTKAGGEDGRPTKIGGQDERLTQAGGEDERLGKTGGEDERLTQAGGEDERLGKTQGSETEETEGPAKMGMEEQQQGVEGAAQTTGNPEGAGENAEEAPKKEKEPVLKQALCLFFNC
ncbi:putative Dynein heavy chain-like protein [Drepanopeziza brunnea f. sp. 'multigermtubi' MB_m1]|uniref:Putative Dynein heavy chain-like protein n=1 Tax=Marssonina brunnea f. sp. multigermtubi (strain MB_m1) TaxID=1072389 RepID=K1WHI6_MARBU|nr:putative Dynein heavy chain-like protein [Drepanopeziza brunnea f. sp. 'multigermtubi' MB_m1]EKD12301.1 putative Dynein heavy chain-like protein [Drepanopeziza brunnea f. sp. 'multigermtubi' MB_m1]